MTRIKYIGDISPCTVRVKSGRIGGWNRDEIKDVGREDAKGLLAQTYFVLANEESNKGKEEEVLEPEEEVPEEELEVLDDESEEEPFDVDNALKDSLLDYTARHNIEADYSNTVKELRVMIKEYMNK